MRIRIEAAEGELQEKSGELIEGLAKAIEHLSPELAERLEKALPRKEVQLKFRALRDLKKQTDKGYARMLEDMNRDIGKVLDGALQKSELEEGQLGTNRDILEKSAVAPNLIDQLCDLLDGSGLQVQIRPELLKSASFKDFTKPIADRDGKKYTQVKAVLIQRGYTESDFEEGGPLYGYSVNQLLDMIRSNT